jgi:hypothetical protein
MFFFICSPTVWLPAGQATLIVIELQIVRKERDELFHSAPVIGIEECAIQRRDGTKKFIWGSSLRRLGVNLDHRQSKHWQEK